MQAAETRRRALEAAEKIRIEVRALKNGKQTFRRPCAIRNTTLHRRSESAAEQRRMNPVNLIPESGNEASARIVGYGAITMDFAKSSLTWPAGIVDNARACS